ncbi:MAG TPA: adenylate/guanylate cyclase domain-containing protein [Gaiellaceae bacterium]|nr:adenylate/guanylate cyclase domain-containing protein [Gaiellaceae bacterium]
MTIGAHRKVVTVLFCDVVGSTALGESTDPEALQALLARYFERMSGIVESHGGLVEKFIGDAVMAVFGVPVAHEDDALRACRAAVEMRDALPELGVQGRIGVNTGEVLTGTAERLATGDAVNVAARLEQAAEPGEVLIGTETVALVAPAVEVAVERPLELKGKSEPVAAHPLVAVLGAPERSHASRFVGRERELLQLENAWDRALTGRRCELVTVVGDPGVGKSRLVAEALALIDSRVVRGRCLSYGEGITYWPVVEVVKQLDALPDDGQAASAIRSLLGSSETVAGTDEIAWGFRKLLEEQAPLVVCFDDIQWAEETFLDLVESTSLLSTGAPLLVLCMARPELLDRRPRWPASLQLDPLAAEEAETLVGEAVSGEVRERIVRASGGNPLFVTEMLALASDDSDVEVPATLRAVLAARLDQLDGSERTVLERGSVEGELFHRGTVQALAPEETEVTPQLAALVRRDLVRPDRPQLPGEDAFRFRHLLIRDAAYDALPKATRADLHGRFAEWLEEHGQSLVELDEIVGYHLEQAALYLAELGRPDPEGAVAAGDRLGAAGGRAFWRGDWRAAIGLLERALSLMRPYRFDLRLEVELADALYWTDVTRGVEVADAAAERAETSAGEAEAALARTVAALARLMTGQCSADELESVAREALPLLEGTGDDEGLVHVWYAIAWAANARCRFGEWAEAMEAALPHLRRAGHPMQGWFALMLAVPLAAGPRPASEALAKLDAVFGHEPYAGVLLLRALLLAMLDRIDEAWATALPADERLRELGLMTGGEWLGEIAVLAGDYEAAAGYLGDACANLEANGNLAELSTYAPARGRALCALGRFEEAETLATQGRDLGADDDLTTQVLWRLAAAPVKASRGDYAEAESLARDAIEIAVQTDSPGLQGDANRVLAEVLEAAGRRDEALAAWREALDRYERKEMIPLARRVRERLSALQETPR